jgi:DNA-binding MarR family transcriptional regulator
MSDLQEVREKCDNPEAKELAETLKMHNLVQISKDYLDDIGELAIHSPTAFRVLMFFIKYMNVDNCISVPDITLQELLGYSKMTIKKAIKHLEENGWLVVWKKKGEPNTYTVNKKIAVK